MRKTTILLLIFSLMAGCSDSETSDSKAESQDKPAVEEVGIDQAQISKTNATEKLVLQLQATVRPLTSYFKGDFDDVSELFAEGFKYQGVSVDGFQKDDLLPAQGQAVGRFAFALQTIAVAVDPADAAEHIWQGVLAAAGKQGPFEDVSFGVLEGVVVESGKLFSMETVFEGRLRDADQHLLGVEAKQRLDWKLEPDGQWKIAKWKQKSFAIQSAQRSLFNDVTATAFDTATTDFLGRSKHSDLILKRALSQDSPPNMGPLFDYFVDWRSAYRYNSCSVVDLDRDGWDDLLVADRWGPAKLLRNKGDGEFEDVSKSCGLKLDESSINCSLFVDFDNDGDTDCLLGQAIHPLTFYRNVDGKFIADATVNRQIGRRRFVTSASVVDINRDGLLDVYVSTYCTGGSRDFGWLKYATTQKDVQELARRAAASHSYLDRTGPPNYVLMNRGGNLEEVPVDDSLKQWACTYQSVWADVDNDGDSDLYICNDFAPDALLRNETPRGDFNPVFKEVSQEFFQGGEMGFAMGASFGDYDSDGDLDLYVSNMYSKAGRRIFQQFEGNVDKQLMLSAQGNFLFRNDGNKFKQVAGLESDSMQVSKVGWSFGGQFADFNNDQKLDLYVPSGFFTPPKEVDVTADL